VISPVTGILTPKLRLPKRMKEQQNQFNDSVNNVAGNFYRRLLSDGEPGGNNAAAVGEIISSSMAAMLVRSAANGDTGDHPDPSESTTAQAAIWQVDKKNVPLLAIGLFMSAINSVAFIICMIVLLTLKKPITRDLLQMAKMLQDVNAFIERPGSGGRFTRRSGYNVFAQTKSVGIHPKVRESGWLQGNGLDENGEPREYPMTVCDGAIPVADPILDENNEAFLS
jgi:hypothetical protein